MFFLFVLLVLLAVSSIEAANICKNPPLAAGFKLSKYTGLWYEIAKYQTAGGAFFQRDCTCTKIKVEAGLNNPYALQSCLKHGKQIVVNATLIPTEAPGKFIQQISMSKVGYWVIELDEDTAIQYDCQDTYGIVNYCIHIMSRSSTMSSQKLLQLSEYALSLGLNSAGLSMTMTNQTNCPNYQ